MQVVPKPLVDLLTKSKRAGKELIGETVARLFLEQQALMNQQEMEYKLGVAELRRQNQRLRFELERKNGEMLRLKGLFNMRGVLGGSFSLKPIDFSFFLSSFLILWFVSSDRKQAYLDQSCVHSSRPSLFFVHLESEKHFWQHFRR